MSCPGATGRVDRSQSIYEQICQTGPVTELLAGTTSFQLDVSFPQDLLDSVLWG